MALLEASIGGGNSDLIGHLVRESGCMNVSDGTRPHSFSPGDGNGVSGRSPWASRRRTIALLWALVIVGADPDGQIGLQHGDRIDMHRPEDFRLPPKLQGPG